MWTVPVQYLGRNKAGSPKQRAEIQQPDLAEQGQKRRSDRRPTAPGSPEEHNRSSATIEILWLTSEVVILQRLGAIKISSWRQV